MMYGEPNHFPNTEVNNETMDVGTIQGDKRSTVKSRKSRQMWLGWFGVFASAFCFYLATATIRWANTFTNIDPSFFALTRFLMGFIVVFISMALQGRRPKPVRYHLLLGRTLANTFAVYCFYQAVKTTTLANANILNMTYPIFIVVLSWFFLRDQREIGASLALVIAFLGIMLILSPGSKGVDLNNLWGLASGISAAGAILYLNISRRYHDSETILFYMFGLGSILIYLPFYDQMHVQTKSDIGVLLLCAAFGVLGQYLLTVGFRYVTAVEGSIISSTRILIAAIVGPVIALDPPLTWTGWIGALLIFGANAYLAVRKSRGSGSQPVPSPGISSTRP